jgi:hypothetical protein
MENKDNKPLEGVEADLGSVQNRVPVNRIILDTPAMLKMVKHC